jgi:hypothetical protein
MSLRKAREIKWEVEANNSGPEVIAETIDHILDKLSSRQHLHASGRCISTENRLLSACKRLGLVKEAGFDQASAITLLIEPEA